jgi:hypothetical protein
MSYAEGLSMMDTFFGFYFIVCCCVGFFIFPLAVVVATAPQGIRGQQQ